MTLAATAIFLEELRAAFLLVAGGLLEQFWVLCDEGGGGVSRILGDVYLCHVMRHLAASEERG